MSIRFINGIATAGLLAAMTACGSAPATPTAPLDLTGTWVGQLGQPASTSAMRLTWTATHSGNTVSGVATIVKPVVNVEARGAMTGMLNGNRLVLVFVVFPDSIPGFPACEIAGTGVATASSNRIEGALSLTFRSCAGTGLEAPASSDVVFTR